MDFLLLYADGLRFDREEIRGVLRGIPGVTGLEERNGTGWVLQAHFDYEGDSTIIRLVDDEESISLSGTGPASLKAVVEIQSRSSVDLRLVDANYTFDLAVPRGGTVAILQQAIDEDRAKNLADG